MTSELSVWLRVVGPLATVGITLIWWLIIVALQTPRRYWRDWLNLSITGVLVTIALYVVARAIVRAGGPDIIFDTQVLIMIGAIFAMLGWPSLARETKRAWKNLRARNSSQ